MIPTDMRYNIKGRWQPGHQWESFYWSIIYTVDLDERPLKVVVVHVACILS